MHNAAISAEASTASVTSTNSAGSNQPHQQRLPQTLMRLLLDGSAPEALWWLPGGKEFAIDANLFPSQVLEVYFPGCKYASFIRRVHKMGFSRETRTLKKVYGLEIPPHAVAFRHPKFLKDRPELAGDIRQSTGRELRKAAKSKQVTRRDSSSTAGSNRSYSPTSNQVASPQAGPNVAVGPALELATSGRIVASPILASRVSFQSLSRLPNTMHAAVAVTGPSEVEEEKQSSLSGLDGIQRRSAIPNPADVSVDLLEFFQRQQQESHKQQLLFQRVEEERRRLQQDEMLRLLVSNQQRRQQHIQELTQEVALRRQLLASALSGTAAAEQPSLPMFGASAMVSTQDEALRRLQLLRRLQQQSETDRS